MSTWVNPWFPHEPPPSTCIRARACSRKSAVLRECASTDVRDGRKTRLQSIRLRGVAQLVERRSPKPDVAGSSPVAPATRVRRAGCHASAMALGQGQAFGAESPVARYWLANSVGFRVEASRGRRGIVERVGCDAAGTDVLLVRPRSAMGRRLVSVPFERVASVDPWAETIVLAPRPRRARRPAREARALPVVRERGAQVGSRLLPVGLALAVAGRRMLQFGFAALRSGVVLLLAMLAGVGASVRQRAPGARDALSRTVRTALLFASAYASEVRRVMHAEWTALPPGSLPGAAAPSPTARRSSSCSRRPTRSPTPPAKDRGGARAERQSR